MAEKGLLKILDADDEEENDAVTALDPEARPFRYYTSEKILGQLYRAIDEQTFLADLHKQHEQLAKESPQSLPLMDCLWDYIQHHLLTIQWEHNRDLARRIREAYESNLIKTLYTYAPHSKMPLSEHEVFSGTILGRLGGPQNKRLRETMKTMRERFEEIVEFTASLIAKGDDSSVQDKHNEALPRALACLAVAMQDPLTIEPRVGELKSFRYIAAGVCLREFKRWRESLGMHGDLPLA
ncbi:hypothetical protein LTR66_002927 [Elasticomyces elasticus]|nr:hypothetical protein LTR66_002927 [Elasticomyces elasticus]KAK5003754.1 hypothetical protein LTR28_009781 [Elasticomyces elasticus]